MRHLLSVLFSLSILLSPFSLAGQNTLGGGGGGASLSSSPKEYTIGGITVKGATHFDPSAIKMFSGLKVGDKITVPGDDISKAIKNLWDQRLFSDVEIAVRKVTGNTIFLEYRLKERPRLSKFKFKGISKSDADDLREKIRLIRGKVVTQNLIVETRNKIKKHYIEDGFYDVKVDITERRDENEANSVILVIDIDEGKRIKINKIEIKGNSEIPDWRLLMKMKDTKQKTWYRFWKRSKFTEAAYERDKQKLLDVYYKKGFRDARIASDSVYRHDENSLDIEVAIEEGKKYYFGDIQWVGNKKYTDKRLSDVLGIEKGDVFDQQLLNTRLRMNPRGMDVSSLYMDQGYLFFNVTPVEIGVEDDSLIDYEMRIYEGQQARIDEIIIKGNTKTHDHVILREIRTRPGDLFNRSDIIRSQRELSQLGYFDNQKLGVNPIPNQEEGTVDIEYKVKEKPSDQIELSGGWGAGRIVGTLGLKFTNFAASKILDPEEWQPLPSGDGQKLTLRAQSNGLRYQSYNFSFTEPWLGGRKPNSFSVSGYHSIQSNRTSFNRQPENLQSLKITGGSVGLGTRLKWPDDYFTLRHTLSYQLYNLHNYGFIFEFADGKSNIISYNLNLSRNSIDDPIFPKRGVEMSLSFKATPPYSAFDDVDDYSTLSDQEKFRWVEFHKWKFTSSWFTQIAGNLVLNTRGGFGYLGNYEPQLRSPFERFYLGGSGLTGYNLDGREIIALRGYDDRSVSPNTGSSILTKFTAELRYPVSLNPQATIYGLLFAEGGNSWTNFEQFDPFRVKRSVGVGVRVFLPMFGLMGIDYGFPMDPNRGKSSGFDQGQFHFTIGRNLGEL